MHVPTYLQINVKTKDLDGLYLSPDTSALIPEWVCSDRVKSTEGSCNGHTWAKTNVPVNTGAWHQRQTVTEGADPGEEHALGKARRQPDFSPMSAF